MPIRNLEEYRNEYLNSLEGRIPEQLDPEKYKEIFSVVPRFCMDAVIRDSHYNKVLLTKRGIETNKGMRHLPGGVLRYGRQPKDMLKKIVKRETGLDIEVERLLDIYSDPLNDRMFWSREKGWQVNDDPKIFTHSVAAAYVAKVLGGTPSVTPESEEIKFFRLNDLPSPIGFHHKKVLEDYEKLLYRQI